VRTSIGWRGGDVKFRSAFKWLMCSRKAPCRALTLLALCYRGGGGRIPRTPIVRASIVGESGSRICNQNKICEILYSPELWRNESHIQCRQRYNDIRTPSHSSTLHRSQNDPVLSILGLCECNNRGYLGYIIEMQG